MNSRSLAIHYPSSRVERMRNCNPCGARHTMGLAVGDQVLTVLKWGALVAGAFALGMWIGKK